MICAENFQKLYSKVSSPLCGFYSRPMSSIPHSHILAMKRLGQANESSKNKLNLPEYHKTNNIGFAATNLDQTILCCRGLLHDLAMPAAVQPPDFPHGQAAGLIKFMINMHGRGKALNKLNNFTAPDLQNRLYQHSHLCGSG